MSKRRLRFWMVFLSPTAYRRLARRRDLRDYEPPWVREHRWRGAVLMTGHELDLDKAAHTMRLATKTIADLRANLAVAEQERDGALASMNAHRCGDTAERAIKRASAAEAALAAVRAVCAEVNNVREYGERGSTFQAGANQLARRIVRALAAAEQDEPTDNACQECGIDNPVWFAPNDVWNAVMGGPDATDDPGGFLCPACFIRRAEASGLTPTGWQLQPEPTPEQP